MHPMDPASPTLTAYPKATEPIPYELGDGPPPGQVQIRPGGGGPVADPLAQTQAGVDPMAQTLPGEAPPVQVNAQNPNIPSGIDQNYQVSPEMEDLAAK